MICSDFQHKYHSYILFTGKSNRFPFLDILGCLKNTHENPKFGRVRQVPIRELGWVFFKYPKISKNGNPLFFSCDFKIM